mgnify:CR=1 FL=1
MTPLGVNQIGGISFTIDDLEEYQNQAREEALLKAREKAKLIAKQSSVRLGRIMSVSESSGGFTPAPYFSTRSLEVDAAVAEAAIEPGSQEVRIYVTLTYELK